ncbi:MAG: M23 family metallopeptidase [Bacilli bacterium]
MDEYKLVKKYFSKNKESSFNIKKYLNKLFVLVILFLVVLIGMKTNPKFQSLVNKYVFESNVSFNKFKTYFKSFMPFKDSELVDKPVFNEKLVYSQSKAYKEGVELKVTTNYLVPILNSGVVVFLGEKEGYGKVIIIQQVNGLDVWYSGVSINNIKIYDYVEKGEVLGETITNKLYLYFHKDGSFINYQEYIK